MSNPAVPLPSEDDADAQGTLAEQLFRRLTEAILRGDLPPGSKISEPLLAQRYGVSRGPLREALHRLQERRLITRSANQGARVVEATPAMLDSIFAVREVLEGLAAREAATRMSEQEFSMLQETVSRHEAQLAGKLPPEHTALGSADHDFHFIIARASGNPLLIEMLCEQFYPLLRLYRSRRDSLALRTRALVEHRRILGAIEEKDAELAEILMRRHIAGARRRRSEALDGAQTDKGGMEMKATSAA
ncbi:GntR family transcriptional regulator [Roseomonas gilardii]|uniref:GntR family transcriptional regulator n=1 Tax=Roseomonas gilardii TaxID=257708 RepID=A0ABU3MJG8_9PROT|nr:GntR family transcriptional regulator [Roseomonas gilardii]MDT8332912.1 GntR family transcriptional regulator [Roseomonas gilardii]